MGLVSTVAQHSPRDRQRLATSFRVMGCEVMMRATRKRNKARVTCAVERVREASEEAAVPVAAVPASQGHCAVLDMSPLVRPSDDVMSLALMVDPVCR